MLFVMLSVVASPAFVFAAGPQNASPGTAGSNAPLGIGNTSTGTQNGNMLGAPGFGAGTATSVQGQIGDGLQNVLRYREEFEKNKSEYLDSLRQRKEEMIQSAQQKRENLRENIAQFQQEHQEQVQEMRQTLLQKLQQFQNQTKARIVSNVDEQLRELNERLLNHYSDLLGQMEAVLANIQSRIEKVAALGTDVTDMDALVVAARNKIQEARAAITTQATKVYAVVVENEDDVRAEVGVARQALHEDLTVVRNAMVAARDAVHAAAVALAQLPNVSVEPSATSTGE